jgi:esterase/lipase superfamily enzyme
MELLIFGYAGAPVLVFPTSMARFYEFEDRGMVGELHDRLEYGHLQLYCVDSVDSESWYNYGASAWWKGERQSQYDRYLTDEVIPLINNKNGNGFLITTGASFGAYQAVNFAFRHPDMTRKVVAMSGRYNMHAYTGETSELNVYYNSPLDYIGGVGWDNGSYVYNLQRQEIYLTVGEYDLWVCKNETYQLNHLLNMKGIGNRVDVWSGSEHDWPLWRWQITNYL